MLQFATILPYERAILYRHGQPVRWLEPGRRSLWGFGVSVVRFDLREGFIHYDPDLQPIIPHEAAEVLDVPAEHLGLLTVDGVPSTVLEPGRYLLWKERVEASAEVVDTNSIASVPRSFAHLVTSARTYTVQISDGARGLMRQNGRLVRILEPGEHVLWNIGQGNRVDTTQLLVDPLSRELEALVRPDQGDVLEISDDQVGVYFIDGVPAGGLKPGRYLMWQLRFKITAQIFDTTGMFLQMPERLVPLLPADVIFAPVVLPYQRGLLYVDGKLVEILEAGRYAISRRQRQVNIQYVDMREQQLQITGQEVMSADKVSLRLNLLLNYQIVDPRLSVEGTTDLNTVMYAAVQLAARRFVAGVTVDRLLEDRNAASEAMVAELKDRIRAWGVALKGMDLKDIILPGEMKTIFNQVIEAEKRAAANVITRREETAATRSLANTARMLENNPTLLRLKELESLKDIAELVGDITVVATPEQLLGQLSISKRD